MKRLAAVTGIARGEHRTRIAYHYRKTQEGDAQSPSHQVVGKSPEQRHPDIFLQKMSIEVKVIRGINGCLQPPHFGSFILHRFTVLQIRKGLPRQRLALRKVREISFRRFKSICRKIVPALGLVLQCKRCRNAGSLADFPMRIFR